MLKAKTIHIDLHLPKSWNQCTTDELEMIAAAIIAEQQRVGRYHPFDWSRVKLDVVLAVNRLSIDSLTPDPSPKGEGSSQTIPADAPTRSLSDIESTWLVKRPQDKKPWPITTGQLLSLTQMLSWLDDEKSDKTIFMFPYPELTLRRTDGSGSRSAFGRLHGKKLSTLNSQLSTLQGPPPLLDGYTWREYRWLTDWMQEYMRLSNAKRDASTAQREFLAILFKPKEDGSAEANSPLSTLNSQLFTAFDAVKWQVILFWWSSLMQQLQKKFPRVFKSQPVDKKGRQPKQKADTPWDFYNNVTASIQKYIGGLSVQDVDNQPYGVTLKQLEMMADESAELERAKPRHP